MSPKRPTLPEGTDPVAALRQLQRQLASAHAVQRPGTVDRSVTSYEEGGKDAERAAGMNLAPVVDAVEALVGVLRQRLQEMDPFGPDAGEPAWYGSAWACPVDRCSHVHREENVVSSTDAEAARRVQEALLDHFGAHTSDELRPALVLRTLDWPAHCSEWIGGSDPENPDMCPEYASPGTDKCALHDPRQVEWMAEMMARQGWLSPSQAAKLRADVHRLTVEAFVRPLSPEQARNVAHGGHPEARPSARVAYPPSPGAVWRPGFPGTVDAETAWSCQLCTTKHVGNPSGCLHCGHTVLDPGHWVALPPAGTEA